MQEEIEVTIKYFAHVRVSLGRSEQRLKVAAGTQIGELWHMLANQAQLEDVKILMAVNKVYARPWHVLHEGDEVAFFPAVTGG